MAQPSGVEGASEVMIEKLESKEYEEGLIPDLEDANCAICLSPYEKGDTLRYLPCKPLQHHFHKDCVDEWLTMNKTCPFCKRSIDAEIETVQSLDTGEGEHNHHEAIDMTFDRRSLGPDFDHDLAVALAASRDQQQ
eukprot:TRINITY_DN7091_c0_g1_i1.p1 TRINITY_DN7091_c0_g1~~TRINITY_DN7091_c0_g1_i1.p1  ORF type:complete len:136 (+),score=20.86 TRINITY_DN7091_c0_g1_i1:186-593(+)